MKKYIFLITLSLLSVEITFSQDTLTTGMDELESTSSFYIITNWSNTYRRLEENEGLFGDSLGVRADETPYNRWSFGIGVRSMLTDQIMFEGGISYMRNGEQYSFEESDTSYIYTSQYSYIAMPLKLNYTFGNKIKLILGGGIVPQMFLGNKKNVTWTSKDLTDGKEEIKTKQGYNTFVVSGVLNLGLEYEATPMVSVLFVPEFKTQFNSSFGKFDSYKHYGRSIGFNIGLTYKL